MSVDSKEVVCSACGQKNRVRAVSGRGVFKCGRCASELVFEAVIEPVQQEESWRQIVLRLYPQIGVAGSVENKSFLVMYEEMGRPENGLIAAHATMEALDMLRNGGLRISPRVMNYSDFPLMDAVDSDVGKITVFTKLSESRTSVMPYGMISFLTKGGFQAQYSTSDPAILGELHHFWIRCIKEPDGFKTMLICSKTPGYQFPFPDELKHLQQYFVGFNA